MTNTLTDVPTFSTAAAAWFEDHSRHIKSSTADSYEFPFACWGSNVP